MAWQLADLADQTGRTVVITGGNSGIGLETARPLAGRGATVVLACRDIERGEQARADIVAEHPGARVNVVQLDLASLDSVRAAADQLSREYGHIDVLINNAGVIPRQQTADGFEMQIGTNHLGHFALSALLFDRIKAAPAPRVVTVSSLAHHFGWINFPDLHGRFFYDPWVAYAQSKLANLLFSHELDRRCREASVALRAVACHPGIAQTNLGRAAPRMQGGPFGEALAQMVTSIIAQSAADGALPTLYAGFADEAQGGDYIGPDGPGETRGAPRKVTSSVLARSRWVARELWQRSEQETGISFVVG